MESDPRDMSCKVFTGTEKGGEIFTGDEGVREVAR